MVVIWIVSLVVAFIILVVMIVFIVKANRQFHDKSLDIKKGMNREKVIEIMEKEPDEIEQLNDGTYKWIYKRKGKGPWGDTIYKTEISFDLFNLVSSIHQEKYLDGIEDYQKGQ